MAKTNPKIMMLTGGTSITRMARFRARCPSFGVAFAFALHMAQPWAKAGVIPKARIDINSAQRSLDRKFIWFYPCCTPTPLGGGFTRSASGKKKKYMMMKHAVTEI